MSYGEFAFIPILPGGFVTTNFSSRDPSRCRIFYIYALDDDAKFARRRHAGRCLPTSRDKPCRECVGGAARLVMQRNGIAAGRVLIRMPAKGDEQAIDCRFA